MLQFLAVLFFLGLHCFFTFCHGSYTVRILFVLLVVFRRSLIKKFFFFRYSGFVTLYFRPAVSVCPFLLVSFPNEFIFCIEQNFFFLCFCFSYCILFNAFSFLF